MKGDPVDIFRKLLTTLPMDGRKVVIDYGTGYSGWHTFRVYFEPPLEPGQGFRYIGFDDHAMAVETAQIMACGELPIDDQSGGR